MDRREGRAAAPTIPASPVITPAELSLTGFGLLRAERYLEAQICCQQALALDPNHADSLHLMGLLSIQSQQYDHAVEWISRAIRRDPRPEFLVSLGRTLQFQGRHEDALKTFDKAVQLKPDDAELWKNLGNALVDVKRPQDALLSFQQALKLVDLTADLTDFVETAALISCLDLVITVDTSVAHLAGALGRPTWILLPYLPDFRWLLDRDDSPWYPTVRLFRQGASRSYTDVIDRVRTELAALATGQRR